VGRRVSLSSKVVVSDLKMWGKLATCMRHCVLVPGDEHQPISCNYVLVTEEKRPSYGQGDSRLPPGQSWIACEVKIARDFAGAHAADWYNFQATTEG